MEDHENQLLFNQLHEVIVLLLGLRYILLISTFDQMKKKQLVLIYLYQITQDQVVTIEQYFLKMIQLE
jgi:hypothetical protein